MDGRSKAAEHTGSARCAASGPTALDGAIAGGHRLARKMGSHPYFLAMDLAGLCGLAAGVAMGLHLGSLERGLLLGGLLLAVYYFPGYPVLLVVKRGLGGRATRSTLIDGLVLMAVFFCAARLCGVPVAQSAAYLAFTLPLAFGIGRLGCFFGGCHFGRGSRRGVTYRPLDLVAARQRWRAFTPDPPPKGPVFPLNLVDALVQFAIAALCATLVFVVDIARPELCLLLYWFCYAAFRFSTDHLRPSRGRRRAGPLTATQLLCALIMALCALALGVAAAR